MIPPIATSTISLGRSCAGHSLPTKVKAAAEVGFQGIEVAIECLEYHAADLDNLDKNDPKTQIGPESMKRAAKNIVNYADSLNIKLFALQPLTKYDSLKDVTSSTIDYIQLWVDLAAIMKCPILQIPTITYPLTMDDISVDFNHIGKNIQRLADMCAKHDITLGYEAPAWGLATTTWQGIDEIIKLADRPNVKHCLDTYHIAAVEAGNPTKPETRYLQVDGASKLTKSLEELKKSIKADDIAYFQLSDANAIDLEQKNYPVPDLNAPPTMVWSRNCRIFPCEPEGVLPALQVCKEVFATGFRGWVSMEVFHVDHYNPDPNIPAKWAKRGMDSWLKVKESCGLDDNNTGKL